MNLPWLTVFIVCDDVQRVQLVQAQIKPSRRGRPRA